MIIVHKEYKRNVLRTPVRTFQPKNAQKIRTSRLGEKRSVYKKKKVYPIPIHITQYTERYHTELLMLGIRLGGLCLPTTA